MEFEPLSIKRNGQGYIVGQFIFTKCRIRNGKLYLRCARHRAGCSASGRLQNSRIHITNGYHNHAPPDLAAARLRAAVTERAADPRAASESAAAIFEAERTAMLEAASEAERAKLDATLPELESVRSAIHRAKRMNPARKGKAMDEKEDFEEFSVKQEPGVVQESPTSLPTTSSFAENPHQQEPSFAACGIGNAPENIASNWQQCGIRVEYSDNDEDIASSDVSQDNVANPYSINGFEHQTTQQSQNQPSKQNELTLEVLSLQKEFFTAQRQLIAEQRMAAKAQLEAAQSQREAAELQKELVARQLEKLGDL